MTDYFVAGCVAIASAPIAVRAVVAASSATPEEAGLGAFAVVVAALLLLNGATALPEKRAMPPAPRPRAVPPPLGDACLVEALLEKATAWTPARGRWFPGRPKSRSAALYARLRYGAATRHYRPEASSAGNAHRLYLRSTWEQCVGFLDYRAGAGNGIGTLVLGDSYADEVSTLVRSWPSRLHDATTDGAFVNVSVGGSTSEDLGAQVRVARAAARDLKLRATEDTVVVIHSGGNDILLALVPNWWRVFLDAVRLLAWSKLRWPVLRPFCGARRRDAVDFTAALGPSYFGDGTAIERLRASIREINDAFPEIRTFLVASNPVCGSMPLARAVMGKLLIRSAGEAGGAALVDAAARSFARAHGAMLEEVAAERGLDCRLFDEAASLNRHAPKGAAAFWLDRYHPSSFGHASMTTDALAALGRPRPRRRVATAKATDAATRCPFFNGAPPPRRFAPPPPAIR